MEEKKLKSVIDIVRKINPDDGDLWVELYTDLPMGIASAIRDKDNEESGVIMISHMIHDWNFADSNGEFLEVNQHNVSRLPARLANWLIDLVKEIMEQTADKKKELPKT